MDTNKLTFPLFIALFVCIGVGLLMSSCRDIDTIRQALEIHTIEGAEYVGMETCALCHEEEVKRFKLTPHFGDRLDEGEQIKGEACESCHGPGSLHVDGDGDKEKIILNSPDRCFACHLDKKAQFQLQYHHPVVEGRMSCADCHDMHSPNTGVNSIIALDRGDEKCFKCHKEMKGPFVFEHDAMREGCQSCHNPHGSVFDKLLVAGQSSLCLRCHWEQGTNTTQGRFGGAPHGAGGGEFGGNYFIGAGAECIDHHRAPHGSNIWRTFNR